MNQELERIQELYDELCRTPTPLQFNKYADDIFVYVDQFDTHVAGKMSRVLHEHPIDPKSIRLVEDLDQKLNETLEGLNALIAHKQRTTELARLLISYLENNP